MKLLIGFISLLFFSQGASAQLSKSEFEGYRLTDAVVSELQDDGGYGSLVTADRARADRWSFRYSKEIPVGITLYYYNKETQLAKQITIDASINFENKGKHVAIEPGLLGMTFHNLNGKRISNLVGTYKGFQFYENLGATKHVRMQKQDADINLTKTYLFKFGIGFDLPEFTATLKTFGEKCVAVYTTYWSDHANGAFNFDRLKIPTRYYNFDEVKDFELSNSDM